MNFLRDIQSDAIDSNVDITTLLRKCKVLATRLKNKSFETWIENELNGYKNKKDLPDYRITDVQSYGDFAGPFGSGIKNISIPPSCLPKDLREIATKLYMQEPISYYMNLIQSRKDKLLHCNWPADLIRLVAGKIYKNMNLLGAWRSVSQGTLVSFIDNVRNRILNFVLEIEKENPEAGEALQNEHPIDTNRSNKIFQTYIMGDVKSLVTSSSNFQQINVDSINNFDSEGLIQYLMNIGIGKKDIKELKEAIKKDPHKLKTKNFGKNVSKWIGKMLSKAASGIWKISTNVAAELITKALTRYYDL